MDNTTTVGILSEQHYQAPTIKGDENEVFLASLSENNKYFNVWYKPGAENMGDYISIQSTHRRKSSTWQTILFAYLCLILHGHYSERTNLAHGEGVLNF